MDIQSLKAAEDAAGEALRAACDALESATDEQFEERQAAFTAAKAAADKATEAVERAKAISDARSAYPAPQAPPAEQAPEARSDARVTKNEPAYRPDVQHSFFRDIRTARLGDQAAAERLRRNQAEARDAIIKDGRGHELRDVTTGTGEGAGLLPPNYLADMLITVRREGSPVADIFPRMPLPPTGMTITMPRVTSGASVDVQTPEGQALSETDIDSDQLTVEIKTIGGLQDMTLQLWERSSPGMDQVIMAELMSLYYQRLDLQVIAGTDANGQVPGLTTVSSTNGVTWTEASPTAALFVPKLYDAIQQIRSNYFAGASHIIMHPRRAAWLASNLSSTFPIIQQGSFNQALGSQDGGATLSFAGLPVVQSANIATTYGAGTNQDEVYVVAASASPLAEGALRFDVHDQPLGNELKIRTRIYNYVAFASERYPKSISVISGTGLIAPTF